MLAGATIGVGGGGLTATGGEGEGLGAGATGGDWDGEGTAAGGGDVEVLAAGGGLPGVAVDGDAAGSGAVVAGCAGPAVEELAGTTSTTGGAGAAAGRVLPDAELAELFSPALWAPAMGNNTARSSVQASAGSHPGRRRLAAAVERGPAAIAARHSTSRLMWKMLPTCGPPGVQDASAASSKPGSLHGATWSKQDKNTKSDRWERPGAECRCRLLHLLHRPAGAAAPRATTAAAVPQQKSPTKQ